MDMLKQMSLKGSFSLCGKGLHTGLSLTVTFNPAPENFGYKIFDDEIGALCHMALSVIGTCTVLYLCTYIEEINLKYPKKEEKEKEKKDIKEDSNN